MQTQRFGIFNHVLGMTESLAITPMAYEEVVAISDTPAHRQLAVELRWSNVLKSFRDTQRSNNADTAIWEIGVIEPDGALKNKEIKATIGPDDNGEVCVTFMLPGETLPYKQPR